MTLAASVSSERGVALPLALMSLGLLVPLMLAFASLSVSEPVIAANQLRASQARALADSGLQYALWGLDTPVARGGLPSPLPASPAPAPFDGRTLVAVGLTGGFTVSRDADGNVVVCGSDGCETLSGGASTSGRQSWRPIESKE